MTKRIRNGGTGLLLLLLCAGASAAGADGSYAARGLLLKIDRPHLRVTVSCQSIPGYMDAMVMPLPVREAKDLAGLAPGMIIDFTLAVGRETAYAESIHVHEYQSFDLDPLTTKRLKLLDSPSSSTKPLLAGQLVPEFALSDQHRRRITLSQFSGKVVLLNFIYTRCVLPNYCLRIANNFGVLQRRFKSHMGQDLVFLTVTFDPVHDTPEILAHYANIWKADPESWHFLTGTSSEVQRLCGEFGVDVFPDEGLMDHSLHTAIIDPEGKLVANLEGNEFTADQLGDLVQTVLERGSGR